MQPATYYLSFLVRVWRDERVGDWHGEIEHIQNGTCHSFTTPDELLAWVRQAIEELEARPPSTYRPTIVEGNSSHRENGKHTVEGG